MISFPPFRLDCNNKCLWKCTATGAMHKLTLAPRAFDMLELLIQNAGRLVTHEELLSALWPNQWVQPEVIKTHIRSIRSVLEDNARQPEFIETHRSRGYRFIADIVSSTSDRLVASPPTDNIVMPTSGGYASGHLALREIAALLGRIEDEQPAVPAIEDTHRAHYLTVDWLFPFTHNSEPARLTVIVSYFPEDAVMTGRPASVLH
ncbi:transcriptional regulator [Trinickia sp. EG282A]|uniref:transcriptional regulator n=1 Tax=Trinickia sp. EG282A TaxID=3237013 RepID=UPI0034D327C0